MAAFCVGGGALGFDAVPYRAKYSSAVSRSNRKFKADSPSPRILGGAIGLCDMS